MQLRLVAALALAMSLSTAHASAPALTDVERLTLQALELRAENLQLRAVLIQQELAKVQADFSAALAKMQRDGFTLGRGQDGQWRYEASK